MGHTRSITTQADDAPRADDTPIYYETHMHTTLCQHAVGEPEEYAAVAVQRGLKGIIVTCHNPLPNGLEASTRMRVDQFDEYLQLVRRAKEAMKGAADVRLGLECDYMPGLEPWLEAQLSSAPFDYVLGSVHPHLKVYRSAFWGGDPEEYQRTYFGHLADAAETGLFDTLAHPDLVKILTASSWSLERIIDHVRSCLDRIAATGCALELNTSGLNKALAEMNPGDALLREARLRDIPIVIGGDAHVPERVGDRFEQALGALERAGYQQVGLVLGRKRTELSIDRVKRSLRVADEQPSLAGIGNADRARRGA